MNEVLPFPFQTDGGSSVVEAQSECITLRISEDDGFVVLEVADDGVGIDPENLTRIFQYGFTTKDEGHGFGLHGSAIAAAEVGGSLEAFSDGPGAGAMFRVRLPMVGVTVSAAGD